MADNDSVSSTGIRTPDQRLRVFVSSTLGELDAERRAARAAIEQLRLAPTMFGSGANAHPAQAVYRAYLEQSDIFVGIYWQRYGWVGPGMTISGLEDEFRRSARLPRLLYIKRPAPEIEPGLRRMLDQLRSEGEVAYKAFADAAELHELLLDDLATLLSERFGLTGHADPLFSVPSPVTALVGRDHDVAQVVRLLTNEDHRLLVLTGAGGIGKTRLALAVAERSRQHWRDGVAFVDLSSVTDPRLVPESIAMGLGFVGQGREAPLDTLARRLAGMHMLLVLDNFEQVLDATPVVARLLQRAPQLRILVTSRRVLQIRGVQEWRVDPLRLAPSGAGLSMLAESPAVQLFIERARNVRPEFELTDANAEAVAELCRQLDGLPLALELAATWIRLLTPEQLLKRLDEHMGRPSELMDLPDRQRTMTATVSCSYDMLPAPAKELLARLSVFAAPFTAEAAEVVCGVVDTTETLGTLLDNSMVSPAERPDGEPAFRLLDVIRRFALGRLENSDETLSRLERYLLDVLERTGAGYGSQDWARRQLDSEQPNLQVVLRWAIDRNRPAGELLRRIGDVWIWSMVRGKMRHGSELRQQIDSWPVSELRSESDRMALHWLTLQELLDDGSYRKAGELIDEILPDARRLEKPTRWGRMLMLRAFSRPYTQDSPARTEFEEAVSVARSDGDSLVLGYVLSHFGLFLSIDGDVAQARALHEEMLRNAPSVGDDNLLAEAHYDLAMDELTAQDPEPAWPHLAFAAHHYVDIDNRDGMARCLAAFSALALERGDNRQAARLIGTAAAARAIGLTPWPAVAESERRFKERVRASLSDAEFAAEEAAGRMEAAETAFAHALAAAEGAAPTEKR